MATVNIWHPVIDYRNYNPTLANTADWVTLTNDLADYYVRDFIYLGHGAGSTLGDDNPTNILSSEWGILSSNVQRTLKNTSSDPLTTYSKHPFRFVFLDGCSTAEGEWPTAFAIPKKQMKISDFVNKRGIRPRAFMGWSHDKAYAADGTFQNPSVFEGHSAYVQAFWNLWNPGPGNVPKNALQWSVNEAKKHVNNGIPSPYAGITVYGATDLMIDK